MLTQSFRKFAVLAASSFLFVGFLPLVPGTFGSIAGAAIYLFVKDFPLNFMVLTLLLLGLGFLVSGAAERYMNKKDARCIVIDEVCGMLLSFVCVPYDFRLFIIGFIFFRIFDALKPYPADVLQKLRGSVGVMSDDIVAGFYTNIVLQIVVRVVSFKAS